MSKESRQMKDNDMSEPSKNGPKDIAKTSLSHGANEKPAEESRITAGEKTTPGESSVDDMQASVAAELEAEELIQVERERFLRLAADFDNYKKRVARDSEEVARGVTVRLLRSLIEIIDNFERAQASDAGVNNDESFRKGIDLIYQQFSALLTREGVTAIESLGKPFDPNLHEAVMQTPSDQFDDGMVCHEVQKGYLLDSRVIRHAQVIVSIGKPQADEKNKEISEA